jgi:hypothetical protein
VSHQSTSQQSASYQPAPAFGIRWENYSHQEMWHMVESADPAGVFTHAGNAKDFAEVMGLVTDAAHKVAQDLVGAWSGDSAEHAANAISEFVTWADETANTASQIGKLLDQYAHVLNRAKLTMPYPVEAGKPTPNGSIATPEQASASKTHAVEVMEHYATQSEQIYTELHSHQFSAPPTGTGLPLAPPSTEPTLPPAPRPSHRQPASLTDPTAAPGNSTTLSDFAGPLSGGVLAPAPGLPDLGGVMNGGVLGGAPAAGGAVAGFGGLPGMSGIGSAAEGEAALAKSAGAAEGTPAGEEFAPMAPPGARGRDRDGERRRKYGLPATESELIGEPAESWPSVFGL